MKKLIVFLLLASTSCYAQVDWKKNYFGGHPLYFQSNMVSSGDNRTVYRPFQSALLAEYLNSQRLYSYQDTPSTVATTSAMGATLPGGTAWGSGCLAPNGKIYGIPYNANSFLIIDPSTDTATTTTMGLALSGSNKWLGGVLASNGKIYCIPQSATTICIIDTNSDTATLSTMGVAAGDMTGSKWIGGCLADNGKIYGIPYQTKKILIIDPVAEVATASYMGLAPSWPGSGYGGALGMDRRIYAYVGGTPNQLLQIDPENNVAQLITPLNNVNTSVFQQPVAINGGVLYFICQTAASSGRYYDVMTNTMTVLTTSDANHQGGQYSPDNCVYMTPFGDTLIRRKYIPTGVVTASNFGASIGASAYVCGILAPNGSIYGIPANAASILKITTGRSGTNFDPFFLSPFFNKF